MRALLWFLPTFLVALALASACEVFDPPPEPRLVGDTDGLLPDPQAPIVVAFSEPIAPTTLRLKIVPYDTDVEGNLPDEDADPNTKLVPYYQHDPGSDIGGSATLDASGTRFRIRLDTPLPVGPRLAILVEPGLADPMGNATRVRRRLLFGYSFDLKCGEPAKALPALATYFLLADVTQPIPTQVQLFAVIRVDPDTGNAIGQFTNADRNRDPSRCSPACTADEACRTVPQDECVLPSERAASVDEFVDFVPNAAPPTGFSFVGNACVHDQPGGSGVLVVAPVDVVVESPPVTLRNAHLVASFAKDDAGILRGTGSFSADAVLLGTTPSGAAKGDLSARLVPPDQVPAGIPQPPAVPESDAGTASSSSSTAPSASASSPSP